MKHWMPVVAVAAFAGLSGVTAVSQADTFKAAMLLPGSINDQSWNDAGYSGLTALKAQGFDIAYSENVPDSDDASAMADYAAHGFNVVMGHSGRFLSAAQQVGPKFPKVQFIVGGGAAGQPPNVASVDYENQQFGCQVGLMAARLTKTGKVGGVYGLEGLPNIVAQAGGFRICAKKAKPDIQVTIIYVKDMEDAAASKEAALSLIADGADFLTGKLNAAQGGLIAAAKEKGVYVTGRSLDASDSAPKAIVTNIIEFWDQMYSKTALVVKDGQLAGSFVKYGYGTADKTTGAKLAFTKDSEFNSMIPKAVVDEIDEMGKQFASGALKVEPTPDDAKGGKS